MTSDARGSSALVGGTGSSEKTWIRVLPVVWQLQPAAVNFLWELVYFDAWGNCSLRLRTTSSFIVLWKVLWLCESVSARCFFFFFFLDTLLSRTAVEIVSWWSRLSEGSWNIWCENIHSGCFLKFVFIHHRRILLIMPSMRHSYSVTIPEEPPATAFPLLKQDMRRKNSMSGSMLVSTFVGLLINHAKVWTRFIGVLRQLVWTFIH